MNTPSDGPVPGATLEALRGFDTPTVCNALELVAPARRAVGFTVEPLVCARPLLPPIVGYARTAAIRAKEPNRADAQAARAERLAYYEYVAAGLARLTMEVVVRLVRCRRSVGHSCPLRSKLTLIISGRVPEGKITP